MLDTNILLTATDEGRAEHERALDVINGWPAHGTTLYTSGQIIREYLSVATMLVHGVDTVVTLNTGDFARFGQHVRVSGLPGQESARLRSE